MPKPTPATSSLWSALFIQLCGSVMAGGLVQLVWPALWQIPLALALVQGVCALLVSHKLEAPPWWQGIHLGFMPLVAAASTLVIAPGWWLAGFTLLLLLFWRTDQSRVPLYLTNATTAQALVALLPARPCHVIDLGCGTGGLLRQLARARPDCEFLGIEHAPIPWLWARLGAARLPNVHIRRGDFWRQHLGIFELAYAFLSPAPMPRLWEKAQAEMHDDGCLVSNSFSVPEVPPKEVIEVADRRATRLFIYRPGK